MSKSNFLLFAGTTEGRQLAGELAAAGKSVTICVATEYGKAVIPPQEGITVHTGRMDEEEMRCFMKSNCFCCVVDATHPYAVEATANITGAAKAAGKPYYRLLREQTQEEGNVVQVKSVAEAADYLTSHPGNALLTTGSKELAAFTQIEGYAQRLYPRILPMAQAVENCCRLGFQSRNIIAMQGPFSKELNVAMLRQTNSRYLVTKNSGDIGGFQEKQQAAKEAGATVIVIARPQEEGLSYKELLHTLLNLQ